ncbi:aminotransferase class III-fold pyridoxal phosphate-dependent enzyme [Candidatus Micrarchaeota archaeon]|nr:aminotransferase class III-fold pyridoxal phosphate-dependent enzyme [Candidatus Micrarchaeota archaeon]
MRFLSNAFNRTGLTMTKAQNATLWDENGQRFTDLTGGIGTAIVGHANPHVAKAIQRQCTQMVNASNVHIQDTQLKLAETLTELSGTSCCFLTNSGTESMETAIKLSRKKSKHLVACHKGFHGRTLGALSLTHSTYRQGFEPLLPHVTHVPFNDADALQDAVTKDTAAFVVEPIQGEGGIHLPDSDYLKHAAEICEKNDALLVLDEVQTAYRTGNWFAFQHFGIAPDVVATAKPLANGLPLGAVLYREDLDFSPGAHGSTFGGNAVSCAAALAVIDVMKNQHLHARTKATHKNLTQKLESIGLKPRGMGLMLGADHPHAKKIQQNAQARGVLVSVCHNETLRLLPPLTIEGKTLDDAVQILGECQP